MLTLCVPGYVCVWWACVCSRVGGTYMADLSSGYCKMFMELEFTFLEGVKLQMATLGSDHSVASSYEGSDVLPEVIHAEM